MGNRNSLIFNSDFELSLRMLLILYNNRYKSLNCTEIVSYDILTIYGQNYNLSENNLNGNNPYSYLEYLNRQLDSEKTIKKLIIKGYVKINYSNKGYTYSITDEGATFVESLESQYATEYLEINKLILNKYKNISDYDFDKILTNINNEEA